VLDYILLHYLTNKDYSMLHFSDVTQNIRTVRTFIITELQTISNICNV